jgi:hypothetical protein
MDELFQTATVVTGLVIIVRWCEKVRKDGIIKVGRLFIVFGWVHSDRGTDFIRIFDVQCLHRMLIIRGVWRRLLVFGSPRRLLAQSGGSRSWSRRG